MGVFEVIGYSVSKRLLEEFLAALATPTPRWFLRTKTKVMVEAGQVNSDGI
jgi:hypothetical protein